VLVGLTALATLFAGMPHQVCRCPSGQIKLFCFSSPAETASCCCHGSCCGLEAGTTQPGASGAKPEGSCCCAQHGSVAKSAAPGAGCSAPGKCCTKTLVLSETQSLSESKVPTSDSVHFVLWATPVSGTPQSLPVRVTPNTPWEAFRVPPPTDHVTILQRLTI
jgi:hypothetical protein